MTESVLEARLREHGEALKTLPKGWDTYNGNRIHPEAVDKAIELALVVAPFFPAQEPQLVPTSDGDVCVEWHVAGWDVELYVERTAEC